MVLKTFGKLWTDWHCCLAHLVGTYRVKDDVRNSVQAWIAVDVLDQYCASLITNGEFDWVVTTSRQYDFIEHAVFNLDVRRLVTVVMNNGWHQALRAQFFDRLTERI